MFALLFCLFATQINCSPFVIPNNDNLADVEDRCTTVIVGKDAGIDGPMTSHTVSSLIVYFLEAYHI